MPAAAELTNTDVIVAPGDEAQIELRVRNLGPLTETFSFLPTGIAQGWTVVDPPTMTLFPGEVGTAEVAMRPPRSAAVSAGRSPFGVRVIPAGAPDEVALADASVTVLAYDERSLSIAQPVLRGRRRAEYDVVIENRGNIQASLRLGIRQDARKMSGRFTPPSIGVDPGLSEAVRLRVRTRRRHWHSGARPVPFVVEGTQEGHPTATASATLLQQPMVSARAVWRALAALAVVAALVLAWFHVVNPAIDDAAQDAVADLTTSASTTTVAGQGQTTAATTGDVSADYFSQSYDLKAGPGQTASAKYVVPTGSELRVTDVIFQNPNRDTGLFEVRRNDSVLYSLATENSFQEKLQFVTPIIFAEGDVLTVQMSCTAAGDAASGQCSIATLVSGRVRGESTSVPVTDG